MPVERKQTRDQQAASKRWPSIAHLPRKFLLLRWTRASSSYVRTADQQDISKGLVPTVNTVIHYDSDWQFLLLSGVLSSSKVSSVTVKCGI
jgi:hypothetical protein